MRGLVGRELVGLPLCDLGTKRLANNFHVLDTGCLEWERGWGGKRVGREQARRGWEELQAQRREGLGLDIEVERS